MSTHILRTTARHGQFKGARGKKAERQRNEGEKTKTEKQFKGAMDRAQKGEHSHTATKVEVVVGAQGNTHAVSPWGPWTRKGRRV